MSRINPATAVGTAVALPAAAQGPRGLAFDGVNIWVTNGFSNNVTRNNPASGVGANIPLPAGATGPVGVAFDGTNIWTTNFGAANVSRILR